MHYAFLLTLLAVRAVGAEAPPAASCITGRDTLRYRELTESELTLYTSAGTRLIDQKHDATITLAFGPSDSVTAWYDSLALEVESLKGTQRPPADALLGQRFRLVCDANGRLTTLAAPAVPPEIRELSDLSQQFTDFLIRVPQGKLQVGSEWTDTLDQVAPETAGASRRYTAITTWRVQRDTLLDGRRARVLSGRTTLKLDAGDPLVGRPGQARSALAGAEKAQAVLAEDGRLLSRSKEGTLTGRLTVRSGSGEQSYAQDYTYRSRITHVE
jgi:hypothetical protein